MATTRLDNPYCNVVSILGIHFILALSVTGSRFIGYLISSSEVLIVC